MINFQKTQLKNGLTIITAPMKETKAVTVLFSVRTGSRYEEKSNNGISHFLEHMFFKGTNKRPNTLDISKELDSVGASYNAFTSEEETGFYVRVPFDHFHLALDILIDMIFNSKFDTEEIEREKGVILEELNMYQDLPQKYIFDLTKELLYGDTPLGRQTVGTKETIRKMTRKDFLNYKNMFYNPNNMVITVAGNPGKSDWIKEIKEYLSNYPLKEKYDYKKAVIKQDSPKLLLHHKKTDQAHLTISFPTFSRSDKRRPILKVLNNILGETMSSRMFTQVRERRGLAYYISTDYWDFQDNGVLMASAGIDIKRIDLAIKVILEEFRKIRDDKINDWELQKGKENLKGRIYLGLEDSMSVAMFLAEQETFWKDINQPEKIIEEISKVTEDDIMKLAKQIFQKKNINLAIISPIKEKTKIEKLLEM